MHPWVPTARHARRTRSVTCASAGHRPAAKLMEPSYDWRHPAFSSPSIPTHRQARGYAAPCASLKPRSLFEDTAHQGAQSKPCRSSAAPGR
eukprot:7056919-Prymnesium_polylepis.1